MSGVSEREKFDACLKLVQEQEALSQKLEALKDNLAALSQKLEALKDNLADTEKALLMKQTALDSQWIWGECLISIEGKDYLIERFRSEIRFRELSSSRLNREDLPSTPGDIPY